MRDKKKTLDKENKKLKLKKLLKKQKLQEKGITLIALVVTIIILLILTGVTLNLALSDNGLFKKVKEAVDKYEKAQEDEEEAIRQITTQMYSEYVGAYVTGYNPTSESDCTIGKEISGTDKEQIFTRDKDMKWRIWDFDGNILRLISDKPTSQKLILKGTTGYNNGVYAINEVCRKLYSNGNSKVTVANLRRSDIQKVSTYNYTEFKHNNNNKDSFWKEVEDDEDNENLIHYGESMPFEKNTQVPAMWSEHDSLWTYGYDKKSNKKTGENADGNEPWEKEFEIIEGSGIVSANEQTIFRESYYCHVYSVGDFQNKMYYDLLFNFDGKSGNSAKYYWLAKRSTGRYPDSYCFGLDYVSCGTIGISIDAFCNPEKEEDSKETGDRRLRPIVTINLKAAGYNLVIDDENSSESNISYKLEEK